jgi:hypothetical protein
MFKNQLFIIIAAVSLIWSACEGRGKEEETKLYDEVMQFHNEAMPKMAEVNRLKRQLKDYNETVSADSAALKDSLINSILILSKAEDGMNDWMSKFNYPNTQLSHDESMKYLSAQKDSVKKVNDDIFMGIAVAKGFLKSAPDSLKTLLDIKIE